MAAVSIVYLLPFRAAFAAMDPDEGILLQGAARILKGELPYRDFFSFYAPGSYYWNAFLLRFIGDSVLVPRTVLLFYGALFSVFTFLLARRLGVSRKAAVLTSLALLVCALPLRFLVMHNWDSTAAAMIALFCAIAFLRTPHTGLAILAGLFTALAILSNQARGAGLVVGFVLGFAALRWRFDIRTFKSRHMVWMIASFLLPIAGTLLFFAAHGGWKPMMTCLLWPLHHYSSVNHLPYGYITMPIDKFNELFVTSAPSQRTVYYFIFSAIFILCALPICVGLVGAACLFWRRPDLQPEQVAIVVLSSAVVAGTLATVVVTRPDFHHVTFLAPLFFFLIPWIFTRWAAPFKSLKRGKTLIAIYLTLATAGYGFTLRTPLKRCNVPVGTRRGTIRVERGNEAIPFIQANFAPGSRLLVHPYLPIYSFLTRTVTPLQYDYLQVGMHSPAQFQEGVEELGRAKPPLVLLEPDFARVVSSAWPDTPISAMQDRVTDYIAHNYRMCRILDIKSPRHFMVMVRKDLNCDRTIPYAGEK